MIKILLTIGAVYGAFVAFIATILTILVWSNIPMIVLSVILWVGTLVCAFTQGNIEDDGG